MNSLDSPQAIKKVFFSVNTHWCIKKKIFIFFFFFFFFFFAKDWSLGRLKAQEFLFWFYQIKLADQIGKYDNIIVYSNEDSWMSSWCRQPPQQCRWQKYLIRRCDVLHSQDIKTIKNSSIVFFFLFFCFVLFFPFLTIMISFAHGRVEMYEFLVHLA
jgi:hypothetical protein